MACERAYAPPYTRLLIIYVQQIADVFKGLFAVQRIAGGGFQGFPIARSAVVRFYRRFKFHLKISQKITSWVSNFVKSLIAPPMLSGATAPRFKHAVHAAHALHSGERFMLHFAQFITSVLHGFTVWHAIT
ncbi:MAG: hypothetical protein GPOALKHO_000534 [Sodalis sp.]|nr:MAG: hypothetical protein GPOALKHO_000534 [Sodalis sp.]